MGLGGNGTVIVTGDTGAVGSAVCRIASERGYDIAFAYRTNEEAREKVTEEVSAAGREVMSRSVDLTVPTEAAEFVEDVAGHFGGVRALVHAGGPHVLQQYLSETSAELFGFHVDNEVKGFFNVVRPALPHLRSSRGAVVAVTTVAVRRFPPRDGLSAGPKAGIEAVVRALAAEEGKYGVRANAVGPGILEDGMAATLHTSGDFDEAARSAALKMIPLRRFGSAEDCAELACFLISEKAGYISGQMIDVDGGYSL